MDVTLHIGAHRTGTTTFQHYMRARAGDDAAAQFGFWGPMRTRKSLFPGLLYPHSSSDQKLRRRAEGRIRMHLELARKAGTRDLLISDENMIGSPVQCLRKRKLYPAIGERMARVGAAFDGQISRIVISIRSLELWWASVCAYSVARGHGVPDDTTLQALTDNRRSWRDVITDLACAVPGVSIVVVPFEQMAGRPDLLSTICTDKAAPQDRAFLWLNRSVDLSGLRTVLRERGEDETLLPGGAGRWQPFTPAQAAALRENYADDLHWLIAGADGLATLTENDTRKNAGANQRTGQLTRGLAHDEIRQRLAHSG